MDLKTGFKDTEIGPIPTDWAAALVQDLARITTGTRNTQDRKADGAYPFFVRSQTVERIDSYSYDGEAVLTAGDGVGTGKVFHYINGKFDVHQRVYRISDFVNVDGYYFFVCFSRLFYSRVMQMTAKSSVDSVRMEMIADMAIPLPPTRAEQKAIADALSDADALIESLQLLVAKKRRVQQGIMQVLLTGKTRLPGFGSQGDFKPTEVGSIPADWDVSTLCSLVSDGPKNGYSGRCSDDAKGTLTLSLAATSTGRLILDASTTKRLTEHIPTGSPLYLKPSDVLVQRSNTLDLVGTTAVFDGPADSYAYPDLMMRLRFHEPVTGRWFCRYANGAGGRRYFRANAAGSSGSMPKLSGATLRAMPVPVPSIDEQAAIIDVLDEMEVEILTLEQLVEKARLLRQGMMQELLTGRIRLV